MAHARAVFVAGITVMELTALLWYAFAIGFFRPHVRWPRVVCAGIAAVIAQFAGMSLVTFALTGRAVPDNLGELASAQLLVPAFLGSGGVAAILLMRPVKQWLELDIAD